MQRQLSLAEKQETIQICQSGLLWIKYIYRQAVAIEM